MGKSNLKEKVSTTWNNVVLHWKTPALGKYVSYKEIIAYGVGGMGVQFVMFFCSLIALSATSFLVGNTIGIAATRRSIWRSHRLSSASESLSDALT